MMIEQLMTLLKRALECQFSDISSQPVNSHREKQSKDFNHFTTRGSLQRIRKQALIPQFQLLLVPSRMMAWEHSMMELV